MSKGSIVAERMMIAGTRSESMKTPILEIAEKRPGAARRTEIPGRNNGYANKWVSP